MLTKTKKGKAGMEYTANNGNKFGYDIADKGLFVVWYEESGKLVAACYDITVDDLVGHALDWAERGYKAFNE